MYAKIHKPKTSGESVYDNKGSSARAVNYLRSEELKENEATQISYLSNNGDLSYESAVSQIDQCSEEIGEGKVNFTALSFNFSQEEAAKINQSEDREKVINGLLSKYMKDYAASFPSKKPNSSDLVYVAKVHDHRKEGETLNKDNQTHIHAIVSNRTKDGQYINPETGNRKHFNKVKFFDAVQKTTAKELGTEINQVKSLETRISKESPKTKTELAAQMKGLYIDSQTDSITSKQEIAQRLMGTGKGTQKENRIALVEVEAKKGNYFNNDQNAKQAAGQFVRNYAQSLKEPLQADSLRYAYKVKNEKGENPSMQIVIANPSSKSNDLNSLDAKKFESLNNEYHHQIVKKKQHISPTEKNVLVLNRKYKTNINYKEVFENKWLDKDTVAYKQTQEVLSKLSKKGRVERPENLLRKQFLQLDSKTPQKIEKGLERLSDKIGSKSDKTLATRAGTEVNQVKSLETRFVQEKVKDKPAIVKHISGTYINPQDNSKISAEEVATNLSNNTKGLSKQASKVTVIKIEAKKGYYFNDAKNAKQAAGQFVENYAQSLKINTKANDLKYYYKVKNEKEENPSMQIIISNRSADMSKSVGANSRSFNYKKFESLNNKYHNKIVENGKHICPTERNIRKLNKEHSLEIDYEKHYGKNKQWYGKDSKEYKETEQLLGKLKEPRSISVKRKLVSENIPRIKEVGNAGMNLVRKMMVQRMMEDDLEIEREIERRSKQNLGRRRERHINDGL